MKRLRINPLVVNDLKEIRDYIAEDNPDAAAETVEAIYKLFEDLQHFPYAGADLSRRVSFKTDYKYYVMDNYVIIYRDQKDFVEIYRVVNRYRDITKIF